MANALLILTLLMPLAAPVDIFSAVPYAMRELDLHPYLHDEPFYLWPVNEYPKLSQSPHYGGGIDIPILKGTPLLAVKSGVVIYVGDLPDTGYTVILLTGESKAVIYGHLSKFSVNIYDVVAQGDLIGLSGGYPGEPGAGRTSGPHLHFQILGWENNQLVLLNTNMELFGITWVDVGAPVPERLARLVKGSSLVKPVIYAKTNRILVLPE